MRLFAIMLELFLRGGTAILLYDKFQINCVAVFRQEADFQVESIPGGETNNGECATLPIVAILARGTNSWCLVSKPSRKLMFKLY